MPDMTTSEQIAGELRAAPGIRLAIVFGSLASGRARSDSDADVAVLADRVLTAAERIGLIGRIAAVTGRPVDLIDLRTAGEPLLGQIIAGGVRLFGSEEDFAGLLFRQALDAADFLPARNRLLAVRRQAWIAR
jgi:predicted nucleotidyltransferase